MISVYSMNNFIVVPVMRNGKENYVNEYIKKNIETNTEIMDIANKFYKVIEYRLTSKLIKQMPNYDKVDERIVKNKAFRH